LIVQDGDIQGNTDLLIQRPDCARTSSLFARKNANETTQKSPSLQVKTASHKRTYNSKHAGTRDTLVQKQRPSYHTARDGIPGNEANDTFADYVPFSAQRRHSLSRNTTKLVAGKDIDDTFADCVPENTLKLNGAYDEIIHSPEVKAGSPSKSSTLIGNNTVPWRDWDQRYMDPSPRQHCRYNLRRRIKPPARYADYDMNTSD